MSKRPTKDTDRPKRAHPPAKTVEARENQLIALAVDLAEKQLRAGNASSQVITHFLKLGSTSERLEKEKLTKENKLLQAKTEALQSQKKTEELYANALRAYSIYSGGNPDGDNNQDDSED